jgi:hypothetical protein
VQRRDAAARSVLAYTVAVVLDGVAESRVRVFLCVEAIAAQYGFGFVVGPRSGGSICGAGCCVAGPGTTPTAGGPG